MDTMQQQFLEAGTLMLAGMIFVFVFLSFLIVFINTVLAKLAIRFPDAIAITSSRTKNKKKISDDVSPDIIAVISASVARYRTERSQSKSNTATIIK